MLNMKTAMFAGMLSGIILFSGLVLACGEKDITIVSSIEDAEYQMEKSACTKSYFPSDGETFLLEESKIQATEHQASHILSDYLLQEYGQKAAIVSGDTEIPGHENHNHGHGNPQLSHGHYSWSFNVRVPGMMGEKAFPLFVDMETGDVYGVGCGLGAGNVVFSPDLARYPDTDVSDAENHKGHVHDSSHAHAEAVNPVHPFSLIGLFFMKLFGIW